MKIIQQQQSLCLGSFFVPTSFIVTSLSNAYLQDMKYDNDVTLEPMKEPAKEFEDFQVKGRISLWILRLF